MKIRILVLTTTLAFAFHSKAQDNDPSLGFGFFGAFPMNQLCDIDYDNGFGMNVSFLSKRFRANPAIAFQWGLRMDFAAMDHRDFEPVVLNTPAVDMGDMSVRNSMYGFFGLARLSFGEGRFNPYIEGLIGHRNLHTKQVITAQNPSLNPDYEPATTFDRVVWTKRFSYGGSVGMTYKIGSGFYLESSVTYTEGGIGAVMPLKNVSQNEQVMLYPHEMSETDMLLINVGVRFRLQKSSSTNSSSKSGPPSPTKRRYTDPDDSNDSNDDPPVSTPPKKKLETKPNKPKVEKTTPELNKEFWQKRYEEEQTGWDIGYPAPALIEYTKHWANYNGRILIPGAGRSYEAEYLFNNGFLQIFPMDITDNAKKEFLRRVSTFPEAQYLVGDFFELDRPFDLILEQTFFCALDPKLRSAYVQKMAEILSPNGILAGVLFEMEKQDGPPFGGQRDEYIPLFEKHFEILTMEPCYNSIPPRAGNELFIEMRKK